MPNVPKFDYIILRQGPPRAQPPTRRAPVNGGFGQAAPRDTDLAGLEPTRAQREAPASPADAAEQAATMGSTITVEDKRLTVDENRELRQEKDVKGTARAMPCSLIGPMSTNTAPLTPPTGIQPALVEIGANTSTYTGAGVTVAVLDTGIAKTWRHHPAFKNLPIVEKDFVEDGSSNDVDGHGTHCAGIVAGQDIDGLRIGVARGVSRILIGKIIGRDGGTTKRIVNGINWAFYEGADVISLSIAIEVDQYIENMIREFKLDRRVATSIALDGYRENIRLFDDLSSIALQKDVVLVAAVGNQSNRPGLTIGALPPSTAEGFIPVTALAKGAGTPARLAAFANSGAKLAAPGEDIWSAGLDGKAAVKSGTSMATPYVAGVACLWYEKLRKEAAKDTDVSAEQVVRRMFRSSRELIPAIPESDVEWGLVQAPQT